MKMTSKMRRINFEERSPYETTQIIHQKPLIDLTPDEEKVYSSLDEYSQTIFPWKQYFSKVKKKHYFFNYQTKQTLWELPEEI